MTKEIEELRNAKFELEELKARKDAIKAKCREHRDSLPNEELDAAKKELLEINSKITERQNQIDELETRVQDTQTETKKIKMENKTMERNEILATAEYRSAFLKKLQGRELNEEEVRSITSGSSSAGAAIPTKTMDMILGQMSEKATLLSSVSVFNIPELLSFPKENVTNDANWVAEDADATNSDDTLTSITLSAYKLIRTVKITAKVSAMSIDAFESWLTATMTKKMTKALENAIINGTGSSQPTGILVGTTFNATNSITVAKDAAPTYDNLVDLEALLDEDYRDGAAWYMNKKTLAGLMKIKDDNKMPIFTRIMEDGFQGKILGYPVKLTKYIADGNALLGDLKAGYVMNFAQGIEYSSSKEAGFMSGATVYRALAQVDGKPTNVGSIVKLNKATT